MIFKTDGKAWNGFIWLGIIEGFYKMPGTSEISKDSAAWNYQLGSSAEGNSVAGNCTALIKM
jgi:hypothetical protein